MLKFLGWLFAAGFMIVIGVAAAAVFIVMDVSKDLPDYKQLAAYEPPVMTRMHAADGSLLAEYAEQRRLFVPIENVPKKLIQAYLAAEDKTFYNHSGLDYRGIFAAAVRYVQVKATGRGQIVGASTITQQVAKNFLLSSEQTLSRKLKEALIAQRIEASFSKDQILELYLNEIFLGMNSYGVAAAALNYFGKSLDELRSTRWPISRPCRRGQQLHPFRHPEARASNAATRCCRCGERLHHRSRKKTARQSRLSSSAPVRCSRFRRRIFCRGSAPRTDRRSSARKA